MNTLRHQLALLTPGIVLIALLVPVVADAQVSTTTTPKVPASGTVTFDSFDFDNGNGHYDDGTKNPYKNGACNQNYLPEFTQTSSSWPYNYANQVKQDAINYGGQNPNSSCVQHTTSGSQISTTAYLSNASCFTGNGAYGSYLDGFFYKGHSSWSGPLTTASRLCAIADQTDATLGYYCVNQQGGYIPCTPDSPYPTEAPYPASTYTDCNGNTGDEGTFKAYDDSDNNSMLFDGTQWYSMADDRGYYIPNYIGTYTSGSTATASDPDWYLNTVQCKSTNIPQNTLSASSYNITAGQAVSLTWSDLALADNVVGYQHDIPYAGADQQSASCSFSSSPSDPSFVLPNFEVNSECTDLESCTALRNGKSPASQAAGVALGGGSGNCCYDYNYYYENASTGTLSLSPTQTTTYTYTCTNYNGTVAVSAKVNVGPAGPVPAATLTNTTPTVTVGGTATLQWGCTNSTSASISPSPGTVTPTSGGTVSGVAIPGSAGSYPGYYTLTCTGANGQATANADITVNNPSNNGSEQMTCTPNTTQVPVNTNVIFTATPGSGWTQQPNQYRFSSGGTPANRASSTVNTYTVKWSNNGTKSPNAFAGNTTTGEYLQVSCQPVIVGTGACGNSPTENISASSNRVTAGKTTTITWSASGVNTSCTVTGPGVNKTDGASSCNVSNDSATPTITAQSTYCIQCDSAAPQCTTVDVSPNIKEF